MAYQFNQTQLAYFDSPGSNMNMAVSCWFNSDLTSTQQGLVLSNNGWALYISAANKIEFMWYYAMIFSWVTTTSNITIDPNKWYHVIVTQKATAVGGDGLPRIYINGALDATGVTAAPTLVSNQFPYAVGSLSYSGLSTPFSGKMAEVAIWDDGTGFSLEASQITNLASGVRYVPPQVRRSSLKLYLPMDDFKDGQVSLATRWRDFSYNRYVQHLTGNVSSAADNFLYP